MKPLVSIIMGSTSDLPVMEKTAKALDNFGIPFEMNALSAHRTPEEVELFAREAAAGMAAHLPGVIAALTPLPVIGVPIKASFEGLDSVFSILQMPPGIPVATVGVNAAENAGILAAQIIGAGDEKIRSEVIKYKETLKKKIVEANKELKEIKFKHKTN
jgi:5-(carboxyamino)imidazole ribonucleotide mutase